MGVAMVRAARGENCASVGRKAEMTLSVAITTFNRAPYCLNQLRARNAPELRPA